MATSPSDSESERTEKPAEKNGTKGTPPPLSRNVISYFGYAVTTVVFIVLVVLVIYDLFYHHENPYNSVVTYLVLPGILTGGVGLVFFGIWREWRRRHKLEPDEYPTLPIVNLNQGWQRRRIFIGVVLFTLFFTLSAVGTYQAYHFTESPVFCGKVCHMVMEPEYTAYQYSPHARVTCVECHIGSGANWYVKSKMSGLRQVWAVATDTYHTPIETPVHNLRPARETCEHCHWPGKFSGSKEKEIWHFSPDQANTPMRYNMLLKVGGGEPEVGLGQGIHWHINENVEVKYWARDEDRLDIPYVEMTVSGSKPQIFRTDDCPDPLPEGAELRTMDCIDCHNRPSHIYRSPRQLIDLSLSTGQLDPSLPYFKRFASDLLERKYESTDEALKTIETVLKKEYADHIQGPRRKELVERNIKWLQELYQRNFFPEQGVDWREYPNHIGHFEWPGCYRCHDGNHKTRDDVAVSHECKNCHDFLDQAEGEAAYEEPVYTGGEFNHPRNLGDIWKGHNCTECHGIEAGEGDEPALETADAN
ncbi:NapC/NirT family cytochrome c [bacterium]|nr:NapC/NirT family cytochrome c [bacterium]